MTGHGVVYEKIKCECLNTAFEFIGFVGKKDTNTEIITCLFCGKTYHLNLIDTSGNDG